MSMDNPFGSIQDLPHEVQKFQTLEELAAFKQQEEMDAQRADFDAQAEALLNSPQGSPPTAQSNPALPVQGAMTLDGGGTPARDALEAYYEQGPPTLSKLQKFGMAFGAAQNNRRPYEGAGAGMARALGAMGAMNGRERAASSRFQLKLMELRADAEQQDRVFEQKEQQFGKTYGLARDKFGYERGRDVTEDAYREGRDTIGDDRYTQEKEVEGLKWQIKEQQSENALKLEQTRYDDQPSQQNRIALEKKKGEHRFAMQEGYQPARQMHNTVGYKVEDRVGQIDKAIDFIESNDGGLFGSTGWFSKLAGLPGSNAKRLSNLLMPVLANEFITGITELKSEAGGIGPISDLEGQKLEGRNVSLDQAQSKEQVLDVLADLRQILITGSGRYTESFNSKYGGSFADGSPIISGFEPLKSKKYAPYFSEEKRRQMEDRAIREGL